MQGTSSSINSNIKSFSLLVTKNATMTDKYLICSNALVENLILKRTITFLSGDYYLMSKKTTRGKQTINYKCSTYFVSGVSVKVEEELLLSLYGVCHIVFFYCRLMKVKMYKPSFMKLGRLEEFKRRKNCSSPGLLIRLPYHCSSSQRPRTGTAFSFPL